MEGPASAKALRWEEAVCSGAPKKACGAVCHGARAWTGAHTQPGLEEPHRPCRECELYSGPSGKLLEGSRQREPWCL